MISGKIASAAGALVFIAVTTPAIAGDFSFSTGDAQGLMAAASRPGGANFEIETADDFIVNTSVLIKQATFTGLIPTGANVVGVTTEIYRVFPNDSDVGRTSGSPGFSTSQVPTRVNSPSDVAYDSRSSGSGLTFSVSVLSPSFTVSNSVLPGDIHPTPGQTTGGNGPVTGQEVMFSVNFTTPIDLSAGHYFFVPQVELDNGSFLWLSAARPIIPPGTAFSPDLQAWTRDANLDPDWLRIGSDIVGTGSFNMAFSLDGDLATPLPATLPLFATGLGVFGWLGWRRRERGA